MHSLAGKFLRSIADEDVPKFFYFMGDYAQYLYIDDSAIYARDDARDDGAQDDNRDVHDDDVDIIVKTSYDIQIHQSIVQMYCCRIPSLLRGSVKKM